MSTQTVAFSEQAAAAERGAAMAELQKTYFPRSESGLILPLNDLAKVVAEVKADLYEMELAKAQVVPFPSLASREKKRGMQSVDVDELQIGHAGEWWERPSPISFAQMRMMVDQTPILSAIVMTRVRQVQRFCRVQESAHGPGFAIRHIDKDHQLTDSEAESVQLLQRFVGNCGWEFRPRARRKLKRDAFAQFMARSVRDSLSMDSAPIETEMKRDRSLGIDGFYAVDGETVRLTPPEGYQGDEEVYALQVVQGRVRTAYTLDDLIYEPRNPRSDVIWSGYGLSEVELLVKIVTGFLNALTLNMRGFSDNAVPRGVLHLTGNYAEEDLTAFRRYWNATVKGIANSWSVPVLVSRDQESKAAFEGIGAEFDEMYFSKWMTFLTSIACAVWGMSPDEINFESFAASKSSLSGSDTSERLADSKDKGLRPLLAYYEGLLTDYVIADFDEKFVFRWTGLDDADEDKRHEIRKLITTVNEARAQEGMEAMEGPLGDAPLNPSLIGPWMQIQQAQQQPDTGEREVPPGGGEGGEEGGEPKQEGEDFGRGAGGDEQEDFGGGGQKEQAAGAQPGGQGASDAPGGAGDGEPDGTEQGGKSDQEEAGEDDEEGDEDKRLGKANPHHDERGQFCFGIGERSELFDKPDLAVVESKNRVLPGERLSDAGKRAKKEILEAFAAAGGYIVNRDSRHSIMVTGRSANHLVHLDSQHQPFKQHIEASFCIPDLLRRAVLAERHPDRKDGASELYVARYYAPFSCDGKLYRAKLTVFEHRADGPVFKLYDHSLAEIELEEVESPAKGGAVRVGVYTNGEQNHSPSTFGGGRLLRSPPTRISVRQLLAGVNRDSDDKPFGSPAETHKSLGQGQHQPLAKALDFGRREVAIYRLGDR